MKPKFSIAFALCVASALFISSSWTAANPTAKSPNEGSQLHYDATNNIWRFTWWAKFDRTYFLQHSEDLITWDWVPII